MGKSDKIFEDILKYEPDGARINNNGQSLLR